MYEVRTILCLESESPACDGAFVKPVACGVLDVSRG